MSLATVFVLIGLVLTVASLIQGIASMMQGGESDQQRSVMYMFRRVGWQALTILFLFLALLGAPK